jgi:hypothetical protein
LSNTRHVNGAAPPSAEVADHGVGILGRTIAVELAGMLGQLLPRMPWQMSCMFCVLAAKQVVRDHEIACQNALAAGEEPPALPEPPAVAMAITQVGMLQTAPGGLPAGVAPVPVCWDHVQIPGVDGPRMSGLVMPDGRPFMSAG